uniref:J domain-containing protein n=1 Tax=viral metagenome TaxID=1070528 RepID=A0A6C0M008_9ZZZZ
MEHTNFYEILEIKKTASNNEIKKAYKRLALKYHPDKTHNTDTCQDFHLVQMAYEILIDDVKRKQYDELTCSKKINIIQCIKTLINDLVKQKDISEIILDEQLRGFVIRGEYKYIKDYIIQKINQHYNNYLYDNDIFISSKSSNIKNSSSIKQYHILENASEYESSFDLTPTHTSERLLTLSVHTTLEEIWMNKVKEITVMRHSYNCIKTEEHKLCIPIQDDKLVLYKEGDEYMDKDGNIRRSDIIIKVKCKKHHFIERVNEYDLLIYLPVTLYELFNGFNKTFKFFDGKNVTIKSSNPLKEYKFDGERMIIEIINYGLTSGDKTRGSLLVILLLNKSGVFQNNLKTYFSNH